MDLEFLANYYRTDIKSINACLKITSIKLNISKNEIISIMKGIYIHYLNQKYNLNNISFDLILYYIFPKIDYHQMLSICFLNKQYYQKCIKNDRYWQNYAQKHFNITQKPHQIKNWFQVVAKSFKRSNIVYEVERKYNKTNLVKKVFQYIYYDSEVSIYLNHEIGISFGDREYRFKPERKLIKAKVLYNDDYTLIYLLAIDTDHRFCVYSLKFEDYNLLDIKFGIKRINTKVIDIEKNYFGEYIIIKTENGSYIAEILIKALDIKKFDSSNYIFYFDYFLIDNKVWNWNSEKKKYTKFKTSFKIKRIVYHILNQYQQVTKIYVLDFEGYIWLLKLYKNQIMKIEHLPQFYDVAEAEPTGFGERNILGDSSMAITFDNKIQTINFENKLNLEYLKILPYNYVLANFTSPWTIMFKG